MKILIPAGVIALAIAPAFFSQSGALKHPQAATIHQQAIVVDTHADTTQRLIFDPTFDIGARHRDGNLDIPRMKEGGLDAVFFSIWVPSDVTGLPAVKRTLDQIDAVREAVRTHADTLVLATSGADVRRAAADHKIAALMGIEGGHMIDDNLRLLRNYAALGVRYMTLTHFKNNNFADSSTDKPAHNGLTAFGKDVVREMNRLGMMVDVSHLSDKAFWDIVNTSTKPVIATHSGCRAIANVPRNLTDDMIVALAKTGGVVNVIFYPEHIEPGYAEKKKRVDAEIASMVQRASEAERGDAAHKKLARDRVRRDEYLKRLPPVSVSRVVDHIDHIVKLVGINHVGIGSDFDGVQAVPVDLKSVADLPNLTTELLRRGYSEADIDKILGSNMLRVMEEVERH
jgi:membrane dipeptidase